MTDWTTIFRWLCSARGARTFRWELQARGSGDFGDRFAPARRSADISVAVLRQPGGGCFGGCFNLRVAEQTMRGCFGGCSQPGWVRTFGVLF
eukprot:4692077-Pyramimonas_sp.AAC.1